MSERVVPVLPGIRWDPNSPAAVLIVTDTGPTALALQPHPAEPGRGCVVFVWSGTREAVMGTVNDEARSGHRLYDRELAELTWAGVVENSERITGLERGSRVHPDHDAGRFSRLNHYILPLKENTVEVVAETVEVQRHPGPPLRAAPVAVQST